MDINNINVQKFVISIMIVNIVVKKNVGFVKKVKIENVIKKLILQNKIVYILSKYFVIKDQKKIYFVLKLVINF